MSRSHTVEEKDAARERQNLHWKRCETWGRILEINKMMVNAHWSCCIKKARGKGDHDSPAPVEVISAVKRSYASCSLRHARCTLEWRFGPQQGKLPGIPVMRQHKTTPPDLAGCIKIMLWSIKTCGGVENAQDALERAVRSLEVE